MAPTDQKMKKKTFSGKDGNWKKSKKFAGSVKKKRKWAPEHKHFEGSVQEGQGFAFKRKQKVKHEYNKILRKEKNKKLESTILYKEDYPEHLKHLYMAEAEKLKNEAWTHSVNRRKHRMKGQMKEKEEVMHLSDAAESQTDLQPEGAAVLAPTDSVSGEQTGSSDKDREQLSLPMSNRMKKKMLKKTSYQKTKEEFERITEKRRKKKEEYLKNKQQREEAIQRYKQKKMETFQMLCKKTKKGQPNLNLQMEYLLQKIQRTEK